MKTELITNEAIAKMHGEDCEWKLYEITYFDRKENREHNTVCLNVVVRDNQVYYDVMGRTFHVPVKVVKDIKAF